MSPAQTRAWIALSLSSKPGMLRDIVAAADMMNHALPTLDELRESLGWLRAQGLAIGDEHRFALTAQGSAIVDTLHARTRTLNKVWDALAAAFELMEEREYAMEEISEEELREAYRQYRAE